MPLKQDALQLQLDRAKTALGDIEKSLDGKIPKKQAMWRKANARVRQIEDRLKSRSLLVAGRDEAAPAEAEAAAE
ncbi:hypothetical protein [Planctomicrobium piriforme]|uniref:50S ribosomal protein L29 n=1 Tax=Planctomicrobium piriforme TaxID=1576369 RepID=A0A1I3GJL1_9PLAN|nr:hypothetical protein [Planctomicrobium piriforme]SFI23361.1 hypothetical protein SAMN05421753_10713 [Planctomicrobium piriforme]